MVKPQSRWKQTTLTVACLLVLLWVIYQGILVLASTVAETSRQLTCGVDTKRLETGQQLKHHPNGCGWVPVIQSATNPGLPYVSPDAYVGQGVTVRDNARVMRGAHLSGVTVISGSTVIGPYEEIRDGQPVSPTPAL